MLNIKKEKREVTFLNKYEPKELFMGRLQHGADLLEELTGICKERNIKIGRIEAIGAVQRACIGFYDQIKREYSFVSRDEPMEILNLTGNISMKDGIPFVHAHITLADSAGKTFGGHLVIGTVVFACEFAIEIMDGPTLEREFDHETGLSLWAMK
jgi:uncharacterized protein